MTQYYFVISSLPYLSYDTENFPDFQQFFYLCERTISQKDFDILKSAKIFEIKIDVADETLKKWYSWESNLRNQLAFLRAEQKKEDPLKYVKIDLDELEIQKTIKDAFEVDSPLIAEDILNKARWSYLDELEFGHYFDFHKLIIYFLKLQILWRRQTFNKEIGLERLNKIIKDFSDLDIHEIQKQHQQ